MRLNGLMAGCLVAAAALPLAAQDARDAKSRVPDSFTPPAGMCRLWIDGVPASQQPAPTDCASALRNRSSNATIVFGPAKQRGESNEWRPFGTRGGSEMVRSYSEARMSDEAAAKRNEARARAEARMREESRAREDVRGREESRSRAMSDPSTKTSATAPTSTPAPAPRKPEKPQ